MVAVHTKDKNYTASVVVVAIPWQNVQEIQFSPSLPAELQVPLPSNENKLFVTSFSARYMEPHWRIFGFSGSFMSHSPHIVGYETKTQTISGMIFHDAGKGRNNTEPALKNEILKLFPQQFRWNISLPIRWQHQTWEQAMIRNLPPTTVWNRIIWASSNSAVHYRGFANGAVQAGMRAALYTLLELRPQTINWHDIHEIQHANVVRQQIGWIDKFKSNFNLYNCTFFSLFISMVGGFVFAAYKYKLKFNKYLP